MNLTVRIIIVCGAVAAALALGVVQVRAYDDDGCAGSPLAEHEPGIGC